MVNLTLLNANILIIKKRGPNFFCKLGHEKRLAFGKQSFPECNRCNVFSLSLSCC
jgi:hypothetical protein